MAAYNQTSFANALKIRYPKGFKDLWYGAAKWAAWCPKTTGRMKGSGLQVNFRTKGLRGSATYAQAISQPSAPSQPKLLVTPVKDYADIEIDNLAIEMADDDEGAVGRIVSTAVEDGMYEFGRSQAFNSWHEGGGARGQLSTGANLALTTLTLRDTSKIRFFEEDMLVEASIDDGKPATNGVRVGTLQVSGVNTDTGVITFTAALNAGIPAITDADFIFRAGDYGQGAAGVLAWNPTVTPTAGDNHFGLDRSVFPTRLAGGRFLGGGADMEDVMIRAYAQHRRNGGKCDTFWMSSIRIGQLSTNMQSKVWVPVKTDTATIGFEGLQFRTGDGIITVLDDPDCPDGFGFFQNRADWEIAVTKSGMPHFDKNAGDNWRPSANTDGRRAILTGYYNIICNKPVNQMNVDWDN